MNTFWRHYFIVTVMLGWLVLAGWPTSICLGVAFQNRTGNYFGTQGLGDKAAWGDYNKDGWIDLCAGGTVFRNNGGVSFTNTGWSSGSDGLWGDFNNDGRLDLFGYTSKSLLQNNGGTSFLNVSTKIPSFGSHVSRGAAWVPLNNKPYLDLFVGGYEDWDNNITYSSKILTYNKTSQQFTATWSDTTYRARGITAADFDRDGHQEIYVSNYRLQPNRLWKVGQNGSMSDIGPSYGVAGGSGRGDGVYGHTIGSAWGDFDNDGYLDLFVGNFSHNWFPMDNAQFLKNLGPSGSFHFQIKKTFALGTADWQESYASPALVDYDNDGKLDLFLTTVYNPDTNGTPNYPRLYHNDGNWHFTDVTSSVGLGALGPTYQAAWADVNNDGFPDLITAGKLFVNSPNGNHWLKIRLDGNGTTVNRSAIGAQVRVYAGGQTITRQVEGGTGEGNQNELTLDFGLGSYNGLVNGDILWPDGTTQQFAGLAADRMWTIPEPSALVLLAIGAASLLGWSWRRRKHAA
jgi:enediyne biosynthesis protein E4